MRLVLISWWQIRKRMFHTESANNIFSFYFVHVFIKSCRWSGPQIRSIWKGQWRFFGSVNHIFYIIFKFTAKVWFVTKEKSSITILLVIIKQLNLRKIQDIISLCRESYRLIHCYLSPLSKEHIELVLPTPTHQVSHPVSILANSWAVCRETRQSPVWVAWLLPDEI